MQITGAQRSGSGSGPDNVACVFVLRGIIINCRFTSPSHSASESQSFRFSVKIISRSPLAWGQKESFRQLPETGICGVAHKKVTSMHDLWYQRPD